MDLSSKKMLVNVELTLALILNAIGLGSFVFYSMPVTFYLAVGLPSLALVYDASRRRGDIYAEELQDR